MTTNPGFSRGYEAGFDSGYQAGYAKGQEKLKPPVIEVREETKAERDWRVMAFEALALLLRCQEAKQVPTEDEIATIESLSPNRENTG